MWHVGVAIAVDLAVRAVLGMWLLPVWGVQAVAWGMVLGPLASALLLGFVSWQDLRGARVPLALLVGAGLGLSAMALAYFCGQMAGQGGVLATLVLMAASGGVALLVLAAWVRWRGLSWVFKF